MKQSPPPGAAGEHSAEPSGDPWAAFGYLVAGIVVYGAAGWGLSVWLSASYWIPIGILVGAGFGLYLVFAQTLVRGGSPQVDSSAEPHRTTQADRTTRSDRMTLKLTTDSDDAARGSRPATDDRGETA